MHRSRDEHEATARERIRQSLVVTSRNRLGLAVWCDRSKILWGWCNDIIEARQSSLLINKAFMTV